MFEFGDYLNICRQEQNMTQLELVDSLLDFDECFKSLDSTTLSRWERGASKPSLSKQVSIIRYFSQVFTRIYPFIEKAERIAIEQSFCAVGFSKLVGKHQNIVMSYPTNLVDKKAFNIKLFSDSAFQDASLESNGHIYAYLYKEPLDKRKQEAFANNKNNYFLVCELNNQYMGHFFILRLKPEVFDDLINFRRDNHSIMQDDIASLDDVGCYYFYGLFAMSDQVISLFFVAFYSYLIHFQDETLNLGVIAASKDGKRMARNMNMENVSSKERHNLDYQSFQASLKMILLNDNVVKMLFNPESCPEE